MTGAFRKGSAYMYPAAAYVDFDGEGYFYSLNLPLTDDAATLDKMLMPVLPGTKADTVILKATYLVSEDAQGIIESELHDTKWQHLFNIDTTNSNVNGHPFVKGTPFDMTVVLDFAGDGASAKVYMDNVLVNERTIDDNYFSAGEWSVMKVQKNAPAYAGEVSVLNVTMDTKYDEAETLAENPFYLYEQDDMFVLDGSILETVEAASIRLFKPAGLRFATKVDTEAYAAVTSNMIKFGTLIAPKDYVEAADGFTKEDLAKLGYVTNYLDVKTSGFYENEALGEGDYFVGSIVNILNDNLDREFAAIGYVEITVDGETYTYYADNYYATSIQTVAQAALADYVEGTVAYDIVSAFAAGPVAE